VTRHEALIIEALAPYTACRPVDNGTLVTTPCLYPGGDCVTVIVNPGLHGYRVADEGAGWQALLAAGLEVSPSTHGRRARDVADLMGVAFRNGSFVADEIAASQLGAAIVVVANASQRWVTDVLSERQRQVERDLRRIVGDRLVQLFPAGSIKTQAHLTGASSKTYAFANLVSLPNRVLIVEPVANHPGAIAASFLKLTDVHNAHPLFPRELVVEHQNQWRSEDLAVLSDASDGIHDIADGLAQLRLKYPEAA
jgi:hypothetical protein